MSRRTLATIAAVAIGVLATAFAVSRLDTAVRKLALPLNHAEVIREQAAEKHINPALIAAVIYAESRFRDQESHAGALGLMQITPQTAAEIAHRSGGTQFVTGDLSDPEINISYGSYYLRYLLDLYDGNEVAALAAYNAGTGNVEAWGGAELGLDAIRFPETRDYVQEVLEKRLEYRSQYADDLGLAR
jgi:soluble lytic murein transglycosylase